MGISKLYVILWLEANVSASFYFIVLKIPIFVLSPAIEEGL